MDKELAVRMEKLYDFKDGEAEKYAVIAYFKQQEKVKNDLLNAAIGSQMIDPEHITLSQQVAMGMTDKELEAYRQIQISNKYGGQDTDVNINHKSKEPHRNIGNKTISMKGGISKSCFTFTNLILCVIAFLLFLLLITR